MIQTSELWVEGEGVVVKPEVAQVEGRFKLYEYATVSRLKK